MSSYGQTLAKRYLETILGRHAIENFRPDWMQGLELDLFWPDLKLAVEFQGDQHYVPVFGFDQWRAQQARDKMKKPLCAQNGVTLVRLDPIDLEYTALFRKLKIAIGRARFREVCPKRPRLSKILRPLNKDATKYRENLRDAYGSVACRRTGWSRKVARYEWLKANGYNVQPPKTSEQRRSDRASRKETVKLRLEELKANQPIDGVVVTRDMLKQLQTPRGGHCHAMIRTFGIEPGCRLNVFLRGLVGLKIDRTLWEFAVSKASGGWITAS